MAQGRLTIKSLPEIKFFFFLKVFSLSQARTVYGISFQTRGANTLNDLSPAVGRVAHGTVNNSPSTKRSERAGAW